MRRTPEAWVEIEAPRRCADESDGERLSCSPPTLQSISPRLCLPNPADLISNKGNPFLLLPSPSSERSAERLHLSYEKISIKPSPVARNSLSLSPIGISRDLAETKDLPRKEGGGGDRRQGRDVVSRWGLPDRRRRRAGPLGDVVGGHCHLQQVPHQHPWLLLRDDTNELAPDGDLLHAACRAAPALLRGEADRRADSCLLWAAQWHLDWPPQPLPWLQLGWLLPDDQAGHYTLHHALGNHLSEQEVQQEHQGLSHGAPPGSRNRIGHRSPAQSPRLDHRSPHHRRDVCQPDSDQPNPEEAKGVVHAAPVPVLAVPIRRAARHRPVRRQAPDEARRLRVQLHLPSRGVHRAVVLDRGVRQLQHVPGDRHDVAGDVPGAGPPQDVLHPLLRLRPAQGPLHVPERRRHPHRHLRHGPLLLLLRLREQEEDRGQLVARIHPDEREGLGAAPRRDDELTVAGEQGGGELRRRAEDGEERV